MCQVYVGHKPYPLASCIPFHLLDSVLLLLLALQDLLCLVQATLLLLLLLLLHPHDPNPSHCMSWGAELSVGV
jgi:hypothetical protein